MLTDATRVLFFDAVGTLIHPEPSAVAVYTAVGQQFGSRLDATAIQVRFRRAFRRQEDYDRAHGNRTDNDREVARWRTIVAEVLDDVTDAEACFQELFNHFARPNAWRVTADAGPILRELIDHGYRLGLASNFDRRLHAVADALPELHALHYRVVSAEVGWRKPAAPFFQKLGEAAEVQLDQILVVGDDFTNDYEGATAAGLTAVLYDPHGNHCGGDSVRVGSLSELRFLLPPVN